MPRKQNQETKMSRVRHGANINMWLPTEIKAAMIKSANQNYRDLTREVLIALIEYLERQGLYERPEKD